MPSLTALVDELEATHHAYLEAALPRLAALAAEAAADDGRRAPVVAAVAGLVAELRANLESHLVTERQVLFPLIRILDGADAQPHLHCGSIRNPIGAMMVEHDRTGDLLSRLAALTDGFRVPAGGSAAVHLLYAGLAELMTEARGHIDTENAVLFPAAVAAEQVLATRLAASAGPDQGGDPACWAHRFG